MKYSNDTAKYKISKPFFDKYCNYVWTIKKSKQHNETFESHCYYCANYYLIEVQFSNDNTAARYKITISESIVHCGYWQPIRYSASGRPYIKDWHGNVSSGTPSRKYRPLYLDNFIKTK